VVARWLATASRASRRAAAAHTAPAGDAGSKRRHGLSSDIPDRAARLAICSAVSSEEWFCGWPSVARPYPLTVYAKITAGRVSSMAAKASPIACRSWPPRLRIAASSASSGDVSSSPTFRSQRTGDRDAAGEFQTTYAATGGSGYLVRPDGYLGFRATPIGTAALRNHLERVFAAQTPTTCRGSRGERL